MGGKSARFSTSIERRGIFLRNILTNVKQNTRTWRPVLLGMLGSNLRMITTLSGQGPANSESKHTNQGPPAELPSLTKHPPGKSQLLRGMAGSVYYEKNDKPREVAD